MSNDTHRYRFGTFILDTRTRELHAAGRSVALTAKAFDVLCMLVEHRHRVVGREELFASVWPGRVVEENNLNQAVSALRQALGTGAGDRQYVVTMPGRGYRFVAEVTGVDMAAPVVSTGSPAIPVPAAAQHLAAKRRRHWGIAITVAAALALAVYFAPRGKAPSEPVLASGPIGSVPASVSPSAAPVHGTCEDANTQAHRELLSGQIQLARPAISATLEAVESFNRVTKLDPTCARAFAALAKAQRLLAMVADSDPGIALDTASDFVLKALKYDADLAEAHVEQGLIQLWFTWDWAASESSLKHAIELNSDLAEAHYGYGNLLMHLDRMEEACPYMRKALALEATSPVFNAIGGFVVAACDREKSTSHLDNALHLAPDYFMPYVLRGMSRLRDGDTEGALHDLREATRLCGECSHALTMLGLVEARAGNIGAAREILRQMNERDRQGYWPASSLATLHNALGETGAALELLERAYDERDVRLSFLKIDMASRWNNLRDEPRFRDLEKRMNFPGKAADARTNTPASAKPSAAGRSSP